MGSVIWNSSKILSYAGVTNIHQTHTHTLSLSLVVNNVIFTMNWVLVCSLENYIYYFSTYSKVQIILYYTRFSYTESIIWERAFRQWGMLLGTLPTRAAGLQSLEPSHCLHCCFLLAHTLGGSNDTVLGSSPAQPWLLLASGEWTSKYLYPSALYKQKQKTRPMLLLLWHLYCHRPRNFLSIAPQGFQRSLGSTSQEVGTFKPKHRAREGWKEANFLLKPWEQNWDKQQADTPDTSVRQLISPSPKEPLQHSFALSLDMTGSVHLAVRPTHSASCSQWSKFTYLTKFNVLYSKIPSCC